ncbi:MAG: glutamyl-tRNA reductase [Methanomicrobiales archaeon]|nr:glutamyl-tRNA reductase [Methanomicrobiales archaeon]
MSAGLHVPVACAGISHHDADVASLEEFRFPDEAAMLADARTRFKGVVLLQTCNRVELLVHGDAESLAAYLKERGKSGFWVREGIDALRHLLRLAAGMDSMIVGEDQILGQLKSALALSQQMGTSSTLTDLCLTKAVHVGIDIRNRTRINNGAVSIGSAAVRLAQNLLGSLEGKHIIVVGSGEMGRLVTQALAAQHLTAMYVTNRTFARAVALADEIGGKAVNFENLYHFIQLSDVVISCTAAPHPVIHAAGIREAMAQRHWPLDEAPRPLIIIDIAQPRDVEEEVAAIPGVHVFTIDDLRSVSEENLQNRKREAEFAGRLIEEEISRFIQLLNRALAGDTLSALHTWAEAIRIRERDKALARIGDCDSRVVEVIDDFSRVLAKKLLVDATYAIRTSAECGQLEDAEALVKAITRGEPLCFQNEE